MDDETGSDVRGPDGPEPDPREPDDASDWTRQRVRDHLVGAGAALLLVAGVVAASLWAASTPAGQSDPPPTATPGPVEGVPDDLAAGETWLGDVVLDAGTVVTPDTTLQDVSATAQGVRAAPEGLTAASLDVEAVVPFDVVADSLGGGSTVAAAPDGQASVTRTVEFAGRELRAVATGTVEVVDGRIVVEPTTIDIGGPQFVARAAAALVRQFVTVEQDVEGLPEGLELQTVEVVDTGFRATLTGRDVRLVQ